jgi:RHS repeat-associated protein
VATPWGQGFSYDGFGNLTAKTVLKGSAPSLSVYVDPATNRVSAPGVITSYDANGNAYQYPGMTYDVENRLSSVSSCCSTTGYGYDAQNKRNFITGTYDYYGNATGYTVVLYSPGGQKLGTYRIDLGTNLGTYLMISELSGDIYFGSRRISTMDRLGSVGKFYPYGEAKGGTNPADTWSFATYWRDSATNLDYADQRYYSYQFGRFMTPDPYMASGGPRDPQSWNRYSYTRGDPINRFDPGGLADQDPCGSNPNCVTVTAQAEEIDYGLDINDTEKRTGTGISNQTVQAIAQSWVQRLQQFNSLQSSIQAQFQSAVTDLGQGCQKVFSAKFDLNLFAESGTNLKFYDTTQSWISNLRVNDLIGGYVYVSLGDIVTDGKGHVTANAAVLPDNNGNVTPYVLLSMGFFAETTAYQAVTLLHEALHVFVNRDDIALASYIGAGNFATINAASAAISIFLRKDCQ